MLRSKVVSSLSEARSEAVLLFMIEVEQTISGHRPCYVHIHAFWRLVRRLPVPMKILEVLESERVCVFL